MLQDYKNLKYFKSTRLFYGFVLLAKIQKYGNIELPFESNDREFSEALSHFSFQELIDEKFIEKIETDDKTYLRVTEKGIIQFHKHHIDYQLDLLKLENMQGSFFFDLIEKLHAENLKKVALYGASDTTKSILKYLTNNNVLVLCVLDDDNKKQGTKLGDIDIIAPGDLINYPVDALIISTIQYQNELYEKAKNIFKQSIRVITLFDMV